MTAILEAGIPHSAKMTSEVKSEPHFDTVRQTLRDTISHESLEEIRRVVRDVEKLSKIERLLLYLELPSSLSALSDPLRQPLNPLGSRFEIQLTITWIKTHLEEDQQVSLPKHEVYDDYLEYCNANSLKPLSTADFGKVMKQVYPQVRPRRLGTRGNSRYCYAGLKKRLKLDDPITPECGSGANNNGVIVNSKNNNVLANDFELELDEAASYLIRIWSEKLLTVKFTNLRDLAVYLVDKGFVDNRSAAAHTVISAMTKNEEPEFKHKPDGILLNGNNAKSMYEHKRKIELPMSSADLAPSIKRPNLKRGSEIIGLSDNSYSMDVKSPMDNEMTVHKQHPAVSVAMVDEVSNQYTSVFEDDQYGLQPQSKMSDVTGSSVVTSSASMDCIKPWDLDQPQSDMTGDIDVNHIKEPVDEELDKYFKDTTSTSEADSQNLKLSQLRHILEKNLKSPLAFKASKVQDPEWNQNSVPVTSEAGGQNHHGHQAPLSTRRRVSFIVQEQPQQVVHNSGSGPTSGPSPGTRKRHFSFQPISPRQASLPQSPLASPFISPRSTPVHMIRSRHSSGSALPLHMLPQGGGATTKGPFGSSGSDISRAATFGSASECSTPFISPHGTPIPFNRSRHNSAQGRLCRSRHSSGVAAPYRYTMTTPFSPMALSNLNNPYSPQPATPLGSTSGEDIFSSLCMGSGNGSVGPYMVDGNITAVTSMDEATPTSQLMMDDRSRHSSAESDPNLVKSAPMSPHNNMGHVGHMISNNCYVEIGGQRLRHQSAGNQPNPALATLKPPDWMHDAISFPAPDELHEADLFDQDHRRSQSVPIVDIPNVSSYLSGFMNSNENENGGKDANGANDDLDLTLSALKDCDKDFSKFVQENGE